MRVNWTMDCWSYTYVANSTVQTVGKQTATRLNLNESDHRTAGESEQPRTPSCSAIGGRERR